MSHFSSANRLTFHPPSFEVRFRLNSREAVAAYRFAFTLKNGPIPKGILVCHKCNNSSSVTLSKKQVNRFVPIAASKLIWDTFDINQFPAVLTVEFKSGVNPQAALTYAQSASV